MEERGKGNLSRGKSDGETIFNLSPTRQSETILSLSFFVMNRYWSLRHGILRNSIYQCSLKSGRNFLEPFLATKLEYLWRQPPIIGPVIPVRENGDTCEINHKEKRAKGSVGNERALVYSYIRSSNTFFPPPLFTFSTSLQHCKLI